MKISEIRNNLFGLADLKGLINENTFDEYRGKDSFDWNGYFRANPERLNLSFLQAMGLTSSPKAPATIDQLEIGDSEIRKHFGDDVYSKIIANPINFQKDKGVANSYAASKKFNRGKVQASQNGTAALRGFFMQNGGNNISNEPILAFEQNPNTVNGFDRNVLDYFYKIKGLAEMAGKYATENGIKEFDDTGIYVGNVEDPFSMFLYFFFDMFIAGTGIFRNYKDNVKPEFKPYVERVLRDVKGVESNVVGSKTSIPSIIQDVLLDPVGLKYTGELYEYSDALYQNFFANRAGIEKLEALLNELPNSFMNFQGAVGYDGRMQGTIGSVVYEALIILKTSDKSHKKLIEDVREYMGSDDFARFRSTAYLARYEMRTNQIVPDDFKLKMANCFGFSYPDEAFDPIRFIDYGTITNGLRSWVSLDDLTSLLRTTLSVTADPDADTPEMCPAEKIFIAAKDINTLLKNTNYGKFGKGPEKFPMTLDILLGDANDGLLAWQKTNTRGIPTAQQKLRAMYDAEKTSRPDEELSFWRLLARNNKVTDVTQTEIYNWLINNSDPSIEWKYEYNRKDHTEDNELGGKSIDIMGLTPTHTYCFEYQGEQHYRPVTVTYEDYTKFPLYSQMREYILEECGFIKRSVGGTKFYVGPEDAGKNSVGVRATIIDAYRKFYSQLPGAVPSTPGLSRYNDKLTHVQGIMERFSPPSVNKNKISDTETLKYFQEMMRQSPENDEIFENPPLGGVIPYIGSPRRFLDEVKTAMDMSRDVIKRNVIREKERLGWVMSYIIPSRATADEKKYTEELAGNSNVFTWDKPGQNKLLGFLSSNNLLRSGRVAMTESKTLFEQIVKELLRGGNC